MADPKTMYREEKAAIGGSSAHDEMKILDDLTVYFRKYAHERPQSAALACLAVGFILGWKLKPW